MVPKYGNTGRKEKRRPFANKSHKSGLMTHGGSFTARQSGAPDSRDDLPEGEDSDASGSGDEVRQSHISSAYSTLLQSLQKTHGTSDQSNKRRKVEIGGDEKHFTQNGANGTGRRKRNQKLHVEPMDDDQAGSDVRSADHDSDDDENDEPLEGAFDSEEEADAASADPYRAHFSSLASEDIDLRLKAKRTLCTGNTPGWKLVTREASPSTDKARISRQFATLEQLPIKERLRESASRLKGINVVPAAALNAIFQYDDIVYGGRTPASGQVLRDLASLHILNHVLKGRDRVLRNNERIVKAGDSPPDDFDVQDQGFTRPKALVLLETREQCYKWVHSILRLFEPEQRENSARFNDTFHSDDPLPDHLPSDYKDLFEGNSDNDFRIGLKFTRKTVKLFSAFYASDILLCSPLGLRRVIAAADRKKRDHDFLSSIEVCILDQADAMQQQNWSHVTFALSHLNLPPKDLHGADLSRIRPFYLDNHALHLRQTMIFTAHLTPEINSLANSLTNIAGQLKLTPQYEGAIASLPFPQRIKQTLTRFSSAVPTADPDARFTHFTSAVLPSLLRAASTSSASNPAGILIFIPSYLDFVRVRNHFAASAQTEALSFGQLSEYGEVSASRRARSHFVSGRHSVLLYSGRAHHFHRYAVRGVKKVVWYGLPDNPLFWGEVLGWIARGVEEGRVEEAEVSCRAIFSRWEALALERIVGSERVKLMLDERKGDTFEFL